MQIYMSQPEVQAMLSFNKKMITLLEVERKELQENIDVFWKGSDPLNKTMPSSVAFNCLNQAKDDLRQIKKKIALLAKMQYSLKHASFY